MLEKERKTMTNHLIEVAEAFARLYEEEWIPAHDDTCPDDCDKIDTGSGLLIVSHGSERVSIDLPDEFIEALEDAARELYYAGC